MLVYNYHPQTGEYVGAETACESPLEPGVYLLPAHGTTDEPPAAGPGYVAVYRDGAWSLVEDHRGEVCYDTATRERHEIRELGPVPAEWTAVPPEDGEALWDGTKWSVPFDVLKERKKREILAARDAAIRGGTTWQGHPIWTDGDAQRLALSVMAAPTLAAAVGSPETVPYPTWTCKDGFVIPLDEAYATDLCLTIQTYVTAMYNTAAELLTQVAAAQSAEDVAAIVWPEGS